MARADSKTSKPTLRAQKKSAPKKVARPREFLDDYDPLSLHLKRAKGIVGMAYAASTSKDVLSEKDLTYAMYSAWKSIESAQAFADRILENWQKTLKAAHAERVTSDAR